MSIEGGLDRAAGRARLAGCDVLQIFTKNSNQWKAKDLKPEEIAAFRTSLAANGVQDVAAHDSYLINLASPDDVLHRRSIDALIVELQRCESLGVPSLIVHPGSHVGTGIDAGIERIAAALDEIHEALPGLRARILLETWAGQGSTIGARFEEIARILDGVKEKERVGVCFDTCHVFAAGYDMRTEEGYAGVFGEFDRTVGTGRIAAFHLNDSKNDLGCRVDRHEHIGKGWIGQEMFRLLMNDARFAQVPMFLETPKGPELLEDIENLSTLRALIGELTPRAWVAPAPREAAPKRRKSAAPADPA